MMGAGHFLDSGSFTIRRARGPGFWSGSEREQYLLDYAAFVKAHADGITHYSNVDAIGDPDMTWKNQCFLEAQGLRPIPVIHFGTDLKWLERYLSAGHRHLSVGGLVTILGKGLRKGIDAWLTRFFERICPRGFPDVKVHGFGVTSFSMMTRYPWYSVDSSRWLKEAIWGTMLVPKKRDGEFKLRRSPMRVRMGYRSRTLLSYAHMTGAEKRIIEEWLDVIGVPLAEVMDEGPNGRMLANLRYFDLMVDAFPAFPRPWTSTRRKGFSGT